MTMRRLLPFAAVALIIAACVGDDAKDPTVGLDASTDGPGQDAAIPLDGPSADTSSDGTTDGGSFVCPPGAIFCETWDDDPLLDAWMQEASNGHTLSAASSTRSPPRALKATLVDTPSSIRAAARVVREPAVADVAKLTLRFDARIARRDAPSGGGAEGPLKIAGTAAGAVWFLAYQAQTLTLHYSREDAGGVMAGPSASFTSGQWHTVEVVLQRRPTRQLTLRVDGGSVAPATDLATFGGSLVRVILGADTEIEGISKPTGATEVELDNVVLLGE
jgi:hypothetical protein